jgi:ribosomal small subunit protein bTHX
MDLGAALLWGFTATALLTITLAAAQGFGLTRLSIPFLLGTIITPSRDRALVLGFLVHLFNGWVFAFLYAWGFEVLGRADVWLGALAGMLHGLFVLTVLMPALPGLHPRMVSEYFGPTPNRQLQPPGFFALHYGRSTPLFTLVAHILYGAMLGLFYPLSFVGVTDLTVSDHSERGISVGKGDKRSRKGKTYRGTYGRTRPKNKKKNKPAGKSGRG